MSTNIATYIIIGVALNLADRNVIWEEHEELLFPWKGVGAKGTLGLLFDGMGDDPVLAGFCVGVADDEGGGIELTSFNLRDLVPTEAEINVDAWIKKHGLDLLTDEPIRLHVVTNFS